MMQFTPMGSAGQDRRRVQPGVPLVMQEDGLHLEGMRVPSSRRPPVSSALAALALASPSGVSECVALRALSVGRLMRCRPETCATRVGQRGLA